MENVPCTEAEMPVRASITRIEKQACDVKKLLGELENQLESILSPKAEVSKDTADKSPSSCPLQSRLEVIVGCFAESLNFLADIQSRIKV